MWAVLPGRAAVQDMDTDHGRLYVAMAAKFLNRADIVAPSSGGVADKLLLRVRSRGATGVGHAQGEPGALEGVLELPVVAITRTFNQHQIAVGLAIGLFGVATAYIVQVPNGQHGRCS